MPFDKLIGALTRHFYLPCHCVRACCCYSGYVKIWRKLPHCLNHSFEELGEDQPLCATFYNIICCLLVLTVWVILVAVVGLQQLLEVTVLG